MLKYFLAGCLMLSTFVVSTPAVFAQSAPSVVAQTNTTGTKITDEELQKFTNAFKQVVVIDDEAKQQVFKVIQDSGIEPERVIEIDRAQGDASFKPSKPITDKETQAYKKILAEVNKIDTASKTRMDNAIKAQKLEPQRFGEILAMLQKDENLRKRVETMLQKP